MNNIINNFIAKCFEFKIKKEHGISFELVEWKYIGLDHFNPEYLFHVKCNNISHYGSFIFNDKVDTIDYMVDTVWSNFYSKEKLFKNSGWTRSHSKCLYLSLMKKFNFSGLPETSDDISFHYGHILIIDIINEFIEEAELDTSDFNSTWQHVIDNLCVEEFFCKLDNFL